MYIHTEWYEKRKGERGLHRPSWSRGFFSLCTNLRLSISFQSRTAVVVLLFIGLKNCCGFDSRRLLVMQYDSAQAGVVLSPFFPTLIYFLILLISQFANLSRRSSGLIWVLPLTFTFGALHLTALSNCECKVLSSRAGHRLQFDLLAVSGNYGNVINRGSAKSNFAWWDHYLQPHYVNLAAALKSMSASLQLLWTFRPQQTWRIRYSWFGVRILQALSEGTTLEVATRIKVSSFDLHYGNDLLGFWASFLTSENSVRGWEQNKDFVRNRRRTYFSFKY